MTYTDSLKAPRVILPSDGYVAVFAGDKYGPNASGYGARPGFPIQMTIGKLVYPGAVPFPLTKHVTTCVYLNLSGDLEDGHDTGRIDVRAVRVGTNPPNDTAVKSIVVKGKLGGWYQHFHTHPEWKGANPKGFIWEVRCAEGISSIRIGTHYAKHYGVTLTS